MTLTERTNPGGSAGLMVVQARLAAHYVAAALRAGDTAKRINGVLAEIARETAVSEIYVTDGEGNIEYTSHPEVKFKFPTDPEADTQAAPFARLLDGSTTVVVQEPRPRELDAAVFQYVGVAGVDQPRIVQVGVAGGA